MRFTGSFHTMVTHGSATAVAASSRVSTWVSPAASVVTAILEEIVADAVARVVVCPFTRPA